MASLPTTYVPGFHDEEGVRSVTYKRLGHTDMMVSTLSFGAAGLGGTYGAMVDSPRDIVTHAIKQGINYIDTAPWYGNGKSEAALGTVIPHLPRNSFYIATKVGRYEPEWHRMFNFTAEHVTAGFNTSLESLGLEYVDLVQVHDVEFAPSLDMIINETLPALEKIRKEGKARYIGITGYPLAILKEIVERSSVKIDTVLSYCRCTMNDNSLHGYAPWFKERGVGVINAAALSMGLFTNSGPQPWHPASDVIKDAAVKCVKHCQDNDVNISRLAVRYSLDAGSDVDTLLVSQTSMAQLKDNLNTYRTPLTSAEQAVLDKIIETYIEPLETKHWEGKSEEKYKRKIQGL